MTQWMEPNSLVLHARPGSAIQDPQYQRQLQKYRKDHQELSKQYQAKDAKCDDLRRKLRDAKAALSSRTRDLELAHKLLTKAGEERAALQESAARDRVSLRKLEMRFTQLQDSGITPDKYAAVKKQAKEVQSRLICCEAELAGRKEVEAAQAREIEQLQRALEVHAGDLSRQVGQDVAAGLLVKVAESHTACLELARQLAAEKDAQTRLATSAAKLQQRLEATELMRADAEAAASQLQDRLERLLGASKDGATERAAMQQALEDLHSRLAAVQSERDELGDALLEAREEAAAAASQAQARERQLHQALEGARQAAHSSAAQALTESQKEATRAGERAALAEARLSEVRGEVELLRQQLDKALSVQAAATNSRNGHVAVLEAQVVQCKERERSLASQLAAAQAATNQLQGQLEGATSQLQDQEVLLRKLSHQETDLLALRAERDALQRQVHQIMDQLSAERDAAESEMSALRQRLSAKESALRLASENAQEVQEQLEAQRRLAGQLSRSKAKLQASLLQQISSVKVKLQLAEQQVPDTAPLADGWMWARSPAKQQQQAIVAARGAAAAAAARGSPSRGGGVTSSVTTKGSGSPSVADWVGWGCKDPHAASSRRHPTGSPGQQRLGGWVWASAAVSAAAQSALEQDSGIALGSGLAGVQTTLQGMLPPSKQLEQQLAAMRRTGRTAQHNVTTLQMGPAAAATAAADAARLMAAYGTADAFPPARSLSASPDYMSGQLLPGHHPQQQQQQQQQQRQKQEVGWYDMPPEALNSSSSAAGRAVLSAALLQEQQQQQQQQQRGVLGSLSRASSVNSRGRPLSRQASRGQVLESDSDSSDSEEQRRRQQQQQQRGASAPRPGAAAAAAVSRHLPSAAAAAAGLNSSRPPAVGREQLLSPISPSMLRPHQQQQQGTAQQQQQQPAGGARAGVGYTGDLTDPYSLPVSCDPSTSSLHGLEGASAVAVKGLGTSQQQQQQQRGGIATSGQPRSNAAPGDGAVNPKLAAARETLQRLKSARSNGSASSSAAGSPRGGDSAPAGALGGGSNSPREVGGGQLHPAAASSRFAAPKEEVSTGSLAGASLARGGSLLSKAAGSARSSRWRETSSTSQENDSEVHHRVEQDSASSSSESGDARGRPGPVAAELSRGSSVGLRSGASTSSLSNRLQQLQQRQQELRQRAVARPAQATTPERAAGGPPPRQLGQLQSPPSTGRPAAGALGRPGGGSSSSSSRAGALQPVPFQGYGEGSGAKGSNGQRVDRPPMDKLLAALTEGDPTLEQLANLEDLLG